MSVLRALTISASMLLLLGCGGSGGLQVPRFTIFASANFPTTIRFAPDGRLFYTEKNTGSIRIILNGALLPQPFSTDAVETDNELGLDGMTLDPNFSANHYVYIFYCALGENLNRVVRYTDVNNVGTNRTVIVDNLRRGFIHNGGRLAFGLDGKFYVTTGDAFDPANSQTTSNLAGKVLRYNPDGTIPADNPIAGNPIFTLGHRNPYGLAVNPFTGILYVSENGPDCDDELNRLTAGGNYGWRPAQPCGDTDPNYIQPIRRYSTIVAPTGITFYTGQQFPNFTGHLLLTCFKEGSLRQLQIADKTVQTESVIATGFDGPTDVTMDANGSIYIATMTTIYRYAYQ